MKISYLQTTASSYGILLVDVIGVLVGSFLLLLADAFHRILATGFDEKNVEDVHGVGDVFGLNGGQRVRQPFLKTRNAVTAVPDK